MAYEKDLAFVIKTFNRPMCLLNLLDSIKTHGFNKNRIYIVDDGDDRIIHDKKYFSDFPNLHHIVTDFDIGLSKGRNIGVKCCDSDFVLLDDDMFIFSDTKIKVMYEKYKSRNLKILTGYSQDHSSRYYGTITCDTKSKVRHKKLYHQTCHAIYDGMQVSDYGINFFISNTKVVEEAGLWPEEIKIGREHVVFFDALKRVGVPVHTDRCHIIGHYRSERVPRYSDYRNRTVAYSEQALNLMQCDIFTAYGSDGETVQYEFKRGE